MSILFLVNTFKLMLIFFTPTEILGEDETQIQ